MSKRFEGSTAIVTGASPGIALGIAERLVVDGAREKTAVAMAVAGGTASVVAFLLSGDAALAGQTVVIDGGVSLTSMGE
jgi:hypothetical protein